MDDQSRNTHPPAKILDPPLFVVGRRAFLKDSLIIGTARGTTNTTFFLINFQQAWCKTTFCTRLIPACCLKSTR